MREFGLMHGLTGGVTGNLDAVLSTDVTDYSVILTEASGVLYAHYYSTTSALAESSPDVIRPDNLGVGDAGRWLLLDVWTGLAALDAIGALTPAANKMPYYTSVSEGALADLTADARTLLDNTVAQGDLAYGSAANTWSQLAKGTEGQIIRYTATIPSAANAIVSGTVVASTSGVAIDFTSIPSWVKRITVMLNGVSTNGTSPYQIQLGDSGGPETSGYDMACQVSSGTYDGGCGGSNYTAGFVIAGAGVAVGAAGLHSGIWVFTLLDAATFLWIGSGQMSLNGGNPVWFGTGKKALSAALDRVRITTVNGTDAFDAGLINILYE